VFADHLDTPNSARVRLLFLPLLLMALSLLPIALLVELSLLPQALHAQGANSSDLVYRLPQCDALGRLCFG
jgi:hypothetical protein